MSKCPLTVGTIIRPLNFVSIGATASIDEHEDISNLPYYRLGIALRPLSNHCLTIGADYLENNIDNTQTIHPFADINLFDGVNLSLYTSLDLNADEMKPTKYQVNIGFNLDKFGVYTAHDNKQNIGLGSWKVQLVCIIST